MILSILQQSLLYVSTLPPFPFKVSACHHFDSDPPPRGGKSGRFCEFNSQKIFSKTRFDTKYLGKHHGIWSFANQNSRAMINSTKALKRMQFSFVFILYLRLKPCQNFLKMAENICHWCPTRRKKNIFSTSASM